MNEINIDDNQPRGNTPALPWVGFSFALLFLLLVIFIVLGVYSSSDKGFVASSATMLIMLCGCFFIIGLVFSIKGIMVSLKGTYSRRAGAAGVVFSILSVLIILTPLVKAIWNKSRQEKIEVVSVLSADDVDEDNAIVLNITGYSQMTCLDKRTGKELNKAKIDLYSSDVKRQLSTWFKVNNVVKKNELVVVKYSQSVDYSEVVKVLDILAALKYTNISVISSNSYY